MINSPTEFSSLTTREEFATELSLLRERSGLSVRDLSAAVDAPLATIGGYLSGRHLPTTAQSALLRRILSALGVTEPAEIDRWLTAAIALRRSPAVRRSPDVAPYRGLFSYRSEDRDLFFGREDLTARLLEVVTAGGLCCVVGPSGSGKSSLLRAGLLAARSGDDSALIIPGTDPNRVLDETLAAGGGTAPTLLVIDQFEEVFTLVASDDERMRFLDRITGLATPDHCVVLGLRADFYAAATAIPALVDALQFRQIVVGAMSQKQLIRVIRGPAERAGFTVEPQLVTTLLADLTPFRISGSAPEAGALPMLSHVLREVCLRARRKVLTVGDYYATGGVSGTVQQSAERVFEALTTTERDLARRLFLRMVNLDEDSIVTRRTTAIPTGEMADVLERFVDERLITLDTGTATISHEALLTAWPRLHDWVADDRAGLLTLRNLRSQAAIWDDHGRDESGLLQGGRLATVAEWLDRPDRRIELEQRERDFVSASQQAQAAERQRVRRIRGVRRSLVTLAVVLALVASALAAYGLHARKEALAGESDARLAGDRALSRQLAGSAAAVRATDPNLAAQLALVAFRTSATVEARSALLDSTAADIPTRILGHQGPTFAFLNSAGSVLAVSDDSDGSVHLYSLADPKRPVPLGVAKPRAKLEEFAGSFTPDGRYLVAGGTGGMINIWDVVIRPGPAQLHPCRHSLPPR